jgi:steroid delta-isomerase-like uncharacterized protein
MPDIDQASAVSVVFEEGWNRECFGRVEDILADTFVFHVGGKTRTMNIGELRGIVGRWKTGFPDLAWTIHSIVASDDRAAAHLTLTGTHLGEWSGLDATARTIDVEHMFFFRFEVGRIVEVWELLDRSALQKQLTGD